MYVKKCIGSVVLKIIGFIRRFLPVLFILCFILVNYRKDK